MSKCLGFNKKDSYYFNYLITCNIVKILKGIVMLKELLKKTFKLFTPINLEKFGYFQIDENLINVEDMINQGLFKYNGQKVELHIVFEKKHENGIKELLILNDERITSVLFIDNTMVYKRVFEDIDRNNIIKQYDMVKELIPIISNKVLENKKHNKHNLLLMAKYVKESNTILNHYQLYASSEFSIIQHESEIDVYYLIKTVQTESDLRIVKVVGDNIYQYKKGDLTSLWSMMVKTGIDFEKTTLSWMTHIKSSVFEKSSFIELNFNNKSSVYIKVQQMKYCEKDVNFVIFKNPHQKNLLNYSAVNILNNPEIFQILVVDYTDDMNITGLYQLSSYNESFMNDANVKKCIMKELCAECLSKETRAALGFKEAGELDDREMMIVEALAI